MPPKLHRNRWLPLPAALAALVVAAIFGAIVSVSILHPQEEPSVRLFLPLFYFSLYWVLAALLNHHSVELSPDGVHDTVGPLPVRLPRTTSRQAIRHCYVRTVVFSHKTGAERTRHYMAGFETANDHQLDHAGPHATEAEAIQSASELAVIFSPPLEIRRISQIPPFRQRLSRLLVFLLWTALALAALFAGFLWEMSYQQSRRSYPARPKSAISAPHSTRSGLSSRQLASSAANASSSLRPPDRSSAIPSAPTRKPQPAPPSVPTHPTAPPLPAATPPHTLAADLPPLPRPPVGIFGNIELAAVLEKSPNPIRDDAITPLRCSQPLLTPRRLPTAMTAAPAHTYYTAKSLAACPADRGTRRPSPPS